MVTCKECGKDFESYNSARGHFLFKSDDYHGEKNEVPEDWRERVSGGTVSGGSGDQSGGESESPETEPASDSGISEEGVAGKVRRVLTTPLDELLW